MAVQIEIVNLNNLKVGDKIQLNSVDNIVMDFLRDRMFMSLEVKYLRAICLLKNDTKYAVTDVCKSCKRVKIKVGKFWIDIRYSQIKTLIM